MSIYSEGTLKIYTSHPIQPTGPSDQPEYCMNQLRSFAMTDTADTFRQGATAFRNARDWTKKQRDKAIRRANERALDSQIGTLATDASFSRAVSFTASAPSQISLNKGSNTTADSPELETSTDELASDYALPAKRSKRN
ncbi:hypothetical protein GJ744_011890 [Endocarpon pusillum]|uniref:Uncharacterized protein n=1 Tax=Endocarpon pusillum TaxID=364733 RepID=A0A8H7AFX6_9EURO|nr:hypothetical protein GJ744_011890 [Endocarpon pusillum]